MLIYPLLIFKPIPAQFKVLETSSKVLVNTLGDMCLFSYASFHLSYNYNYVFVVALAHRALMMLMCLEPTRLHFNASTRAHISIYNAFSKFTNARYGGSLYSYVPSIICLMVWMWSIVLYLRLNVACSGVWKLSNLLAILVVIILVNNL